MRMIILTFSDDEENVEKVIEQFVDNLQIKSCRNLEITAEPPLTVGGLTLYPEESRIEYNCQSRSLGHQQFAILYVLARSPGKILRKSQIYSLVWEGATPIHVDETIRYHISELRKVLLELTGREYIETARGIGYKLKDNEK